VWRDRLKATLARADLVLERTGLRLQPLHYYSETPARRLLAQDRSWAHPQPLPGVHWDLEAQRDWLASVVTPYRDEVAGLDEYRRLVAEEFGPGYGPIESQVLHCVVRALAPPRVVEVGSGLSTMVTLGASRRNAAEGRGASDITCVEPFPRPALRRAEGVTLVAATAQAAPAEIFGALQAGDLLFLDSTHAVKTGSELARLYLEIVPSLPPGVTVHIHDIFLPYTYAPDILTNLFDWQETTLVAALLTGNPDLSVLACLSALHDARGPDLARLLPDYRPWTLAQGLANGGPVGHYPSSLWLRTGPPEA
jgi:hypothetical protein